MTTDFSKLEGWKGQDLPDGVQALIITRKFAAACAVMAGNFQQVYEECVKLLDGCDGNEVAARLQNHPFYMGVMEELAWHLGKFPPTELYRKNAQELFDLVRGDNTDAIMHLCFAMWVTDGADLPDGLIEVVQKVEEADEQNLLDDLTGEEE